MTEFSYGAPVLEVPEGRALEVDVRNAGRVDHDLVIDALGVRLFVPAGRSAVLRIPAPRAGAYVVYCSIPTHREAGMAATLLVR